MRSGLDPDLWRCVKSTWIVSWVCRVLVTSTASPLIRRKRKNCQSEFFFNDQYLLLDELEADLGQGGALIRICGVVFDLPGPYHGFAVVFGP